MRETWTPLISRLLDISFLQLVTEARAVDSNNKLKTATDLVAYVLMGNQKLRVPGLTLEYKNSLKEADIQNTMSHRAHIASKEARKSLLLVALGF
jgi:hypothetical protein